VHERIASRGHALYRLTTRARSCARELPGAIQPPEEGAALITQATVQPQQC
jgi:hypothetical protein